MCAAFAAALRGDIETLRRCIECKPAVLNAQHPTLEHTLLTAAAVQGYTHMVQCLLDLGAQVNAPGRNGLTAFQHALDYGHADVMDLLRVRGAPWCSKRRVDLSLTSLGPSARGRGPATRGWGILGS